MVTLVFSLVLDDGWSGEFFFISIFLFWAKFSVAFELKGGCVRFVLPFPYSLYISSKACITFVDLL